MKGLPPDRRSRRLVDHGAPLSPEAGTPLDGAPGRGLLRLRLLLLFPHFQYIRTMQLLSTANPLAVSITFQTVWKRSGELAFDGIKSRRAAAICEVPHDRSPAPRGREVTGGSRPPSFTPL